MCVHVIMRPHTARRPTNKSEMVWHALYVRRLMAWTVVNSVFTVVSILYSFNHYRATNSRLDRPVALGTSDACNGQAMLDTVSVSTGATKMRVMDVAPDKDWEDGATAFLFPLPDPVGSISPRHAPGTDHLLQHAAALKIGIVPHGGCHAFWSSFGRRRPPFKHGHTRAFCQGPRQDARVPAGCAGRSYYLLIIKRSG